MKFFFSTKTSLLTLVMLFLIADMASQSKINSAYSRYGLGLQEAPGSAMHFGMGGVTTPFVDPYSINFANPASYSFLEMTTLQVTAKGSNTRAVTASESSSTVDGMVHELAMAFKKNRSKWGFAIGLTPYSSVDYVFRNTVPLNDSLNVKYTYTGSGGINKAIVGTSRLFLFSTRSKADSLGGRDTLRIVHQLSVGANVNYLFGTLNRTDGVAFSQTNYFTTISTSSLWSQGFIFEGGLFYKVPLAVRRDDQRRVIGGTYLQAAVDYQMNRNLRTSYSELVYSYYSNARDTASEIVNDRGRLRIPQRISIGLALKKSGRKWGTLTLAGDYKIQDWTKYKLSLSSDARLDKGLDRATTLSLGIDYRPSTARKSDLLHRLNYRAGIRSTDTYLTLNNTQIQQKAISAGLTIPVIRSDSKIFISAEYGSNGTTNNGLIREDFLNFMVGVTLTPRETWFYQKKYD